LGRKRGVSELKGVGKGKSREKPRKCDTGQENKRERKGIKREIKKRE
jgi:hypothetical protein